MPALESVGTDTIVAPQPQTFNGRVGLQAIGDGNAANIRSRVRRQINPLQGLVNANGTAKPDSHTIIDPYVNEMYLELKYLV
jgi:hypothetical protein